MLWIKPRDGLRSQSLRVHKEHPMTRYPESHLDLLRGRHTAVLTTVSPTGYPHNAPVLFLLDDDGRIKISVGQEWGTRATAVAEKGNIFIHDPFNSTRYIEIHADLEVEPDPDLAFERRVGRKYGIREFSPAEQGQAGRMILVANPVRISTIG
jgi:hypothetical protein